MGGLLTAGLVFFDIIAIVDALRGKLSIEKKVLWIVLIIFVPVVGMLLYFLLGRPEQQTA